MPDAADSPAPAAVCDGLGVDIAGRCILDQVSLRVQPATVVGILGANGAGKSTLLAALGGLRQHQRGRLEVLGRPVRQWDAGHRRRLGIIPQETALYDELTACENLEFAAALYGVHRARERVLRSLERLGLERHAHTRAGRLSGGLRRRVAIARALVHDPELLLIDEPTLGVDADTRELAWAHLRGLRAQGASVVIASNYLDEILALCDMVALLADGRIRALATPGELMDGAGCQLEIGCAPAARAALRAALLAAPLVSSIADSPQGLALTCRARAAPAALVRLVLELAPMATLRTRDPDLTAIMRALGQRPA